MMKIKAEHYVELEVIIAGGSTINTKENTTPSIGDTNSNVALEVFNDLGIKISKIDIGGEIGRRISVNCHELTYIVEPIPRIEMAS